MAEIPMAESILDLRHEPKHRAYGILHANVAAVLAGIEDEIAGMATISALVHTSLGHLWTGFYRVVADQHLRIGPYQGNLGCLDIPFGSGVCGTAARDRRTIIVPDVSRFPGHIACDARARSEIVVPVFNGAGTLIAVFDVDSARPGRFDEEDQRGLEAIVSWFANIPLRG
jgi:L-methionine (R)-S-oxide reductase